MVEIPTLSADERSTIWQTLSGNQQQAFSDSITYRLSDRVLNKVFHGAAIWRLFAVNIDHDWDLRKTRQVLTPPLKCLCGRRLRYQFELQSMDGNRRHLCLGSTHFAEHLGIPIKVASEVRKHVNQVQSLMDEVLIKFRSGERFPYQFEAKIDTGILSLEERPFREHILSCRQANLPLTEVEENRMVRLLNKTDSRMLTAAIKKQLSSADPNSSRPLAEQEKKRQRELLVQQRVKEQAERISVQWPDKTKQRREERRQAIRAQRLQISAQNVQQKAKKAEQKRLRRAKKKAAATPNVSNSKRPTITEKSSNQKGNAQTSTAHQRTINDLLRNDQLEVELRKWINSQQKQKHHLLR